MWCACLCCKDFLSPLTLSSYDLEIFLWFVVSLKPWLLEAPWCVEDGHSVSGWLLLSRFILQPGNSKTLEIIWCAHTLYLSKIYSLSRMSYFVFWSFDPIFDFVVLITIKAFIGFVPTAVLNYLWLYIVHMSLHLSYISLFYGHGM